MGPDLLALANELSRCWAAFSPAGCWPLAKAQWLAGGTRAEEWIGEGGRAAATASPLFCLPTRTTSTCADTAAGTSLSPSLPLSLPPLPHYLTPSSLSVLKQWHSVFVAVSPFKQLPLFRASFHLCLFLFFLTLFPLTLLPKCIGTRGSRITWLMSTFAAKVRQRLSGLWGSVQSWDLKQGLEAWGQVTGGLVVDVGNLSCWKLASNKLQTPFLCAHCPALHSAVLALQL